MREYDERPKKKTLPLWKQKTEVQSLAEAADAGNGTQSLNQALSVCS